MTPGADTSTSTSATVPVSEVPLGIAAPKLGFRPRYRPSEGQPTSMFLALLSSSLPDSPDANRASGSEPDHRALNRSPRASSAPPTIASATTLPTGGADLRWARYGDADHVLDLGDRLRRQHLLRLWQPRRSRAAVRGDALGLRLRRGLLGFRAQRLLSKAPVERPGRAAPSKGPRKRSGATPLWPASYLS